jgi:membrane protease YdiL (CAAX protease family)
MTPLAGLRRRAGVELAFLAVATALFLGLVPARPLWADVGLALGALALVAGSARETRERFWDPPPDPWRERAWRSTRLLLVVTAAGTLVFWLLAGTSTDAARGVADVRHGRLLPPGFVVALGLFVPWAWLQQALVQFYLLGRMRALLPKGPRLAPVGLTALAFGAVHLPDWPLALLATAAGLVWSYAYQRDRILAPIALSHALLGTTYFAWVRGHDLLLAVRHAP